MSANEAASFKLEQLHRLNDSAIDEHITGNDPRAAAMEGDITADTSTTAASSTTSDAHQADLDRRTRRKLDFILLPFLSILFLFNSLDKSNIGSAETGHFTKDLGLPASALNISLACFFAVFVALQPVGAALGRKYGMARYVPTCMALWGLCTALHIAVRSQWQLIVLRTLVGMLEAGFYPTTVSYLSLFYTRYEFAKRLGLFYGQAAVAGAMGGLLSWAVFRSFPDPPTTPDAPPPQAFAQRGGWKAWQILFLIEGCTTIVIALFGFVWLPHSADTAWFFSKEERAWAELRIRRDVDANPAIDPQTKDLPSDDFDDDFDAPHGHQGPSNSRADVEEGSRLLSSYKSPSFRQSRRMSTVSAMSVTADTGLSRADIISAVLDWKIWYLLICNILSAIPATAFSVFLPLVIKGLAPAGKGELAPALANLLTVPPFLAGACILWIFSAWSDRRHERLIPILWGLAILLVGLTATVMLPPTAYIPRYIALVILLSGSFVPSPLTVAWLANNIPEPGKRAIVLGINGWGNLAGVLSALLFAPRFANNGYVIPFYFTLASVLVAFVGFLAFRAVVVRINERRERVTRGWSSEEVEREGLLGDVGMGDVREGWIERVLGGKRARSGDSRLTFRYGL